MRKKIFYLILIFSLPQCGCDRSQKRQNILDRNAPKVVEARGYVVPKDSMAEPKVITAGKPRVVRAWKPTVVLTNTNVHPAGIPKTVIAGLPRVCTPGQDSFSLPKTVFAVDSPFTAGIPEVVIAREAYTKEQNQQSFSSFGRLQGLKSDDIKCLLVDRGGNLWFGTDGGGVSKYDGKSFTNYTKKEGLINNAVWSILEDRHGNLWFGSGLAGVSKYDGKRFTHFTEREGLINNDVRSIQEDKNGNLWFGTNSGVSMYDGVSFTQFTLKEGLSGNRVASIVKDKSGNLWFGTDNGISKYDGKSFTNFSKKEGLGNNHVHCIVEDKNSNLWFGGDGATKYDGKSFTHFTEKEGLINNSVLSMREDKSGNIWFGSGKGGVSKYDIRSFTHYTEKEGLNNYEVWSILEDRSGNIWIGTWGGGVSKYDGESFTHFTKKEGLSENRVVSILEDKSGNLWFGTGGVSKYDGKSFTHITEKEGFIHGGVWTILEDKSGNLWFGTNGGVFEYDGKSFTHFTTKEGLLDNNVMSIMEDKSGNLWFGVVAGVCKYDGKSFTHFTEKEGLTNNFILCLSMLQDKSGNLWFGSAGGGVSKFNGKSFTHFTEKGGLSSNHVGSILEDKRGNLWFGTGGGVSKYDGKNFTHFTEKEGLSSNVVLNIIEDKSGDLWFGTAVGLCKLEKDKLASYDIRRANGPATNYQDSLVEPSLFFNTYTYEDGFSGIGVNMGKTIWEAKDGTIWIGSYDRLTAFHPGEKTTDTSAPNIQLTGVTLFDENIAWQNLLYSSVGSGRDSDNYRKGVNDTSLVLGNGVKVHDIHFDSVSRWYGIPQHLSLPYNNNYLTFQFIGVTMQSPKKVKYKYKLEGLDQNWSALTNRTEAHYGNLPHGKYTFKVKAMSSAGYWSKEFNYSFTIRPPWWRTWWAYTLFALLFAGFIYAFLRYRINKIRMQHEIVLQQHKASELEMQALRAQMNPHFIFNSLNSINMFILENNKLQASEYLSKFSKLVRLILQNSQEAFIPLERELEALQLYLELESLRFEAKFEYKISVDDEVDTTMLKVPPLIIQPYVENAIWHGLMHKKEKGQLKIELYQQKEILFCKIADNGIGRKKAADLKSKSASIHKSMGMRITADRIRMLQQQNQKNTSISINDLVFPDGNAGGTEVLMKIPLFHD